MRRLILIVAALGLLAGAGVAVAHDGQGKTVKNVSATITATTGGNIRTDTCTGSDGNAYATTRGEWTGTATGTDPSLTGNATIDARAVVNTTTGYGEVSGHIRIDSASGHTSADFDSVDTNGNLAGLAEGHGSAQWSQLVGNVSGAWSASGGFPSLQIGNHTSGGDAVLLTSGGCQAQQEPKPDTIDVHGVVTAASSTSVTAAGVTCTVPSNLTATVTGLNLVANTSRVEMKCVAANGTNTLQSINLDNDHNGGGGDDQHSPQHH